ncbi:MAG: DUF2283 domain-containing protein [Chloroflexi bacterium]|nr:DUF2283 domain-containing protein [Chloroflexota bacterium]
MRITYDAAADAAYIYLAVKTEPPETRRVDDDIYLDFDAQNRLVGIEVLDASLRLPLLELMPSIERIDDDWVKLTQELKRRKDKKRSLAVANDKLWVEEIDLKHVLLRNERTGKVRKVKATELLSPRPDDPLIELLREMGEYGDYSVRVS